MPEFAGRIGSGLRFCRSHDAQPELVGYVVDHLWSDGRNLSRVSQDQRVLAHSVDQPRDPAGAALDGGNGVFRKYRAGGGVRAGDMQPSFDVTPSFFGFQRFQLAAKRDALLQLSQLHRIELLVQLGLANKQDLQQFLFSCLQVRQQTNLLEHIGGEVMCLVNNENRDQLFLGGGDEVPTQFEKQLAFVFACGNEPQIPGNVLQELEIRELRVVHVGVADVRVLEHLEQVPDEHRLAGADLARQYDESLERPNAVVECGQGFVVPGSRIEKRG